MQRWILFLAATGLVHAAAADDLAAGRAAYQQTCVACHGANGKGALPGVASFRTPDGPLSKPDDVLVQSILEGRQTAGSALTMPPKGGNPALTEADARALVAFLRAEFGS